MELKQAVEKIKNLAAIHPARRGVLVAAAFDLQDSPAQLAQHVERAEAEAKHSEQLTRRRIEKRWAEAGARNALPVKKFEPAAVAEVTRAPVRAVERPVTVTWGTPTRKAEEAVKRRPERLNNTPKISTPVDLPPRSRHGTEHAYSRYRCRCEPCRAAKRDAQRTTNFEHGTVRGYLQGNCRCDDCRRANADAAAAYRASKKKK